MNKVDIIDVSILIPVRIDCIERYQNLLLVLKYICRNFLTNIIVLEAGENQYIKSKVLPKGVEYYFVYDTNKRFHRTRYINQLIRYASTTYIAIYDTDVIFPIQQIEQTMILLRQESCSYVSPYNGSFVMLDEEAKSNFIQEFNVACFEKYIPKNIGTRRSWGGAFFVNKSDFIEAGMCNEHLTSWGPDDIEQKKRMEILGYKIKRVEGYLFHLYHPRGMNSNYSSIEERIFLMNEYMAIISMTKEKLERYISSWSWRKENTFVCDKDLLLEIHQKSDELLKLNEDEEGLFQGNIGFALIYFILAKELDDQQIHSKAIALLKNVVENSFTLRGDLQKGTGAVAWVAALINEHQLLIDFLPVLKYTDSTLQSNISNGKAADISLNNGSLARAWYLVCRVESYCKSYCSFDKVFYEESLAQVLDDLNEQLLVERNISNIARVYILFYYLSDFSLNQMMLKNRLYWLSSFTENYFGEGREKINEDELRLIYAYSYVAFKTENIEMKMFAEKCLQFYDDKIILSELSLSGVRLHRQWHCLLEKSRVNLPSLKFETPFDVMSELLDVLYLPLGKYGWLLIG